MPFDPQTDGYPYPRISDQHYLKVEERRHFDFDEHYNFIDESRSFKFKRFWFDILLALVMSNHCHSDESADQGQGESEKIPERA